METPDIDNEHGVPWQVVYGISGNTRAFWSLSNARRVLGYEPEDDSELKYADDVREILSAPGAWGSGGTGGNVRRHPHPNLPPSRGRGSSL